MVVQAMKQETFTDIEYSLSLIHISDGYSVAALERDFPRFISTDADGRRKQQVSRCAFDSVSYTHLNRAFFCETTPIFERRAFVS